MSITYNENKSQAELKQDILYTSKRKSGLKFQINKNYKPQENY